MEHLTDHLFLKYFLISGVLMAIIAHHKYDKISKEEESPILSYFLERIGLFGFVLINFLFGFINLIPYAIINLWNYYLDRKIIKYKKMIADNKMRMEKLKNIISETDMEAFENEAEIDAFNDEIQNKAAEIKNKSAEIEKLLAKNK